MPTTTTATGCVTVLFALVLASGPSAVVQSPPAQIPPLRKSQDQRRPGIAQTFGGATEQQILRGSITPERRWWDLQHYDLSIQVFPDSKSIVGTNRISLVAVEAGQKMQVDLQVPLKITAVSDGQNPLTFKREGNVYWIDFPRPVSAGQRQTVVISYQGVPTESKNPPWSGGLSWDRDTNGEHFIATSCQGIGASIWWPCKDHLADEPDAGMDIRITVPDRLSAVSNGRLVATTDHQASNTKTFHWAVKNPINNYGVNMNIGNYVHFSEVYRGEAGDLDVDYWVLKHQREQAIKQFKEGPRTLEAFEYWFGKYPFYEDSYKIVSVPYLGMEHQSSVTYGNGFQNGYLGADLSGTGVGLKFDFIIVHESGHEWFGNNVTMKDTADMWIHESFTNYAEALFIEYHFSKKEAQDYVIGCRKKILNDRPMIGTYDRNQPGSLNDIYYKGASVLHMLRQIVDDDQKWRMILRNLNAKFWHQTVTTKQIESFLSQQTGMELNKFFDQYLRTTDVPRLKYSVDGDRLSYQFQNAIDGLTFPVKVAVNGQDFWLTPTVKPQTTKFAQAISSVEVDRNFYLNAQHAD